MKQLKCEMCGSTDVLKQEGVFVCQNCGTKYSAEDAKKMMVEGTVDVQGTVKVDNSDSLKNLFQLARSAKEEGNAEQAKSSYELILKQDATNWEALYFVVYYEVLSSKLLIMPSALDKLKARLETVFTSIEQNVLKDEQAKCISEIFVKTKNLAMDLPNSVKKIYLENQDVSQAEHDSWEVYYKAFSLLLELGDQLDKRFNSMPVIKNMCVTAWKEAFNLLQGNRNFNLAIRKVDSKDGNEGILKKYTAKIQKYEPSYQDQGANFNSGGCYVATCVYGSYDCPEVWTLRRYRDYTLAETWYGRAFIKTYYAISPAIVEWFGNTEWFKKLWRKKLDRMVDKLNKCGYENTKYSDKF